MRTPGEMLGDGDVYKINLLRRLEKKITYDFQLSNNNNDEN